jgi:ribosomal protein L33
MRKIEECCDSMKQIIEDGTILPAQQCGQMYVRGKNDQTAAYNNVMYCPFCGKHITIINE